MQHRGQIARVSQSLQSPIIKAHSSLIITDKIGADADGDWKKKNFESWIRTLGNTAKHIKGAFITNKPWPVVNKINFVDRDSVRYNVIICVENNNFANIHTNYRMLKSDFF